MKRLPLVPSAEPKLDMSSLIDVSFLLLIYFVVTSTLDPIEADLGMEMPVSIACPVSVEFDPLRIEVNETGEILAGGELLDADVTSREVPLLLDRLRTYAESARLTDTQPGVILAAADSSTGQRFVDVLNALASRGVQISKVTLEGFE